jgi:hypothetical protein
MAEVLRAIDLALWNKFESLSRFLSFGRLDSGV